MGYRPKRTPFTYLKSRHISYEENGSVYSLISLNRDTMTLEVHITTGKEERIDENFPFAHLPKRIKQELNPLKS